MIGCSHRAPSTEECFYLSKSQVDKEVGKKLYWESFRAEAAKDILCAMISTVRELNSNEIDIALDITDNLISKLKEKEEK